MSNELVRKGYENAAERYLAQRDQFASTPYLDMLAERLKPGATVLDAGCGAGIPIDRYLVQHGYCVIGLDIAKKQIALARTLVPQATYQVRDMSTLKRGEFQVDAVVSFYAIFHTRRETRLETIRTFHSFLPSGGLILVTMGTSDSEGTEENFHGVPMYWSQYDSVTNAGLIEAAGFAILHGVVDASGDERHQVVLALKTEAYVSNR